MDGSSEVWTFVEHRGGEFHRASLETLGLAASIAGRSIAVVLNPTEDLPLDTLCADEVWALEGGTELDRSPGAIVDALVAWLEDAPVAAFLFGGTTLGSEVGVRFAVRTGRSLLADCLTLRLEGDRAVAHRPGPENRFALRQAAELPAVAVIQPGAHPVPDSGSPVVRRRAITVDGREDEPKLVRVAAEDLAALALEHAKVIVAGGRGLDGPDGFALLDQLASLLGGTVGASRMATDLGWIGADRLVGQTGKTVRPTVYVACGISGATQHVLGMRESDTIVAINVDPHAPLVGLAEVAAVGDLHQIIPELIARLAGDE